MIDNLRRLSQQKASRPILGGGIPQSNEGIDGDFRLITTSSGVKLYAKYAGQWLSFSPDVESNKKDVYLLHGGFTETGTSEAFWYVTHDGAVDTGLASAGTDNDEVLWLAPFKGRVTSIFVRCNLAPGETTIKVYRAENGDEYASTEIGSDTINWDVNDYTYTAIFAEANFNVGDGLTFSHTQAGSGPAATTWTAVIEIDN